MIISKISINKFMIISKKNFKKKLGRNGNESMSNCFSKG